MCSKAPGRTGRRLGRRVVRWRIALRRLRRRHRRRQRRSRATLRPPSPFQGVRGRGRGRRRQGRPRSEPRAHVEWLRGTPACKVDTLRREVLLADGRILGYGTQVFATGATPRRLRALEGAPMPVTALRTSDDAQRIRAGLRLVVIGGH
ncbi:MAG: FAD-dependent oxidoreductase [Burkholderiales bacterium]